MLSRTRIMTWSGALVLAACGAVVALGPLDPPAGPVASTYKTLVEVEPRTAITPSNTPGDATTVFRIAQPGSYYLTGNVEAATGMNGITIAATNVTLDLNGFRVSGQLGPMASGIRVMSGHAVRVRNGFVAGWQSHGITALEAGPSAFEDLTVTHCMGNGMDLGSNARVERCTVSSNSLVGLSIGSNAFVAECTSKANLVGFSVNEYSRLSGCVAAVNGTRGIIVIGLYSVVTDNTITVIGSNNTGLIVGGSGNTISSNVITGNRAPGQVGLSILGTGNTVRDNLVRGTPDNYDIAAGNQLDLVLSELPESIDRPANVRLAGSLTGVLGQNGITIAADNVTLDLGGHALDGVGGSVDGISVPAARRNLVVRNGTIRSWGSSGVWATNAIGARFEKLSVDQNGQNGLLAGAAAQVVDCTALGNGIDGIQTGMGSVVRGCVARSNTFSGIVIEQQSQALDCTSASNTSVGILARDGCQVTRCDVTANGREGIYADNGVRISECNVRTNLLDGIRVASSCLVVNNSTSGNGGAPNPQAGILAVGTGTRIEANNLAADDQGIVVTGANNFIARNTLRSAPPTIAAGNSYGPFINVAGVNDISGAVGADHPQANFIY